MDNLSDVFTTKTILVWQSARLRITDLGERLKLLFNNLLQNDNTPHIMRVNAFTSSLQLAAFLCTTSDTNKLLFTEDLAIFFYNSRVLPCRGQCAKYVNRQKLRKTSLTIKYVVFSIHYVYLQIKR